MANVRYKSHSRQLGWRVFVCIIYGVQNLFSLILACAHVFSTKICEDNLCCELRKATHDSMKLQKLSTSQNPEPHGCTDSQISSGFGIFYLAELTIDRSVSWLLVLCLSPGHLGPRTVCHKRPKRIWRTWTTSPPMSYWMSLFDFHLGVRPVSLLLRGIFMVVTKL